MKKYIPRVHYEHHEDIPDSLANYMLLCSDSESIKSVPLDEINGFIDMMEDQEYQEYYPLNSKLENQDDG